MSMIIALESMFTDFCGAMGIVELLANRGQSAAGTLEIACFHDIGWLELSTES